MASPALDRPAVAPPLIALLTDFGLADHYVGSMKGVILGICPTAQVVDITHDVPAFDIAAGAFALASAAPYFPSGTIFTAVVDPGVGSTRRAIAAAIGCHTFVAPDNGVLTAVLGLAPSFRAVELRESRYARPDASRTFEGRDRFAPAAAWLARGIALDEFGPPAEGLVRLEQDVAQRRGSEIVGVVARIDRFGNAISNIDAGLLGSLPGAGPCRVWLAERSPMLVVGTYADAPSGGACALVGSSGYLELSVNCGSAAERLGAKPGAVVRVSRSA